MCRTNKMRRFISMLLCVTIILSAFPAYVFAAEPELDFDVETAGEVIQNEDASLAAATVPDDIPVYLPDYGELVYLEDFEDGSTGNGFSHGSNAYIYTSMTVVDDPAGEGDKAALNTASIMTAQVDSPAVKHFDSVTVMAEAYVPASLGSANGWCRIAFNDAKCDWSTYNITETDKWITVSETVTDIDAHSKGIWVYELSGKGVYFDNFRAYAKYDLGNKVRLVDGNTLKFIDGDTTAPAPESAGNNAWKNEDGDVYMTGDKIPAGETVTAVKVKMPVAPYDKNLGELVYLEDFEDGSAGNGYKTLGNNAYIWTAGNIVDNPDGEGKAFVSTATYTQLILEGDYSVKGTEVTFMVDILNKDGVSAHIPVCFMDSWLDPWNYWTNDQISKTEWTTKSVTKKIDTNLTSQNMRFYFGGMGMHVDNVKIYAKYDLGTKVRLIEGYTLTHAEGGSKAPTPENDKYNAWENEAGKIYAPGDTLTAGETLTAVFAELEEKPEAPEEEEYDIPVYSAELGELVYLEDFEDSSTGNAYTTIGSDAHIWTAGNIVKNPNGEGKTFVSTATYTQLIINGDYSVKGTEVTFMVDFLNKDGASTHIPVCFMDSWLDPWDYWTNDQISKTEWTTKSVTKKIDTNLTSTNMRFYFGGMGMHVDNVRVYAKYDLGTKVRFVDGNELTLVDAANGYTVPAPVSAGNNVWTDEAGKIYKPGDTVEAGKTLTAAYMPESYDAEYGELIYFENFSDGSWSGGYTVGKNAYFYQNGGVEEGKKYGTGMYPSIMEIVDLGISSVNKLTFKMDVRKTADSTATGVAIWGDGYEAWPAFSVEDVTADAWTTKTKTFNNVTLKETGNNQICFGFAGLYVDNIYIYADYSLGNKIKLIDLETTVVELDGYTTYTFPAIADTLKNVWADTDGNEYMPGDTVNVSEIAGKTFVTKLVKFDEVAKLELSADEITEDNGTLTVTPVISYITGVKEKDLSDIKYVTDTANASLTKNDDGTLTVTGQMNGDVTITAYLPERITSLLEEAPEALEATISVSGQSDRIVSSTFKVMMFGNSIREHGEAPGMGWYGNWGMAASSRDKDYAHRFIYYMNEKFGEGAAELVPGYTPAGFENAAASCTEYNEADFVSYVNGFVAYVEEYKPDIVTLQLGENGSESVKSDIYAKVMAQVIGGIKDAAPDAVIVISAPFWSAKTSGKVVGTYAAAKECGVEVAPVYTLGQGAWDGSNPNMAFGASWVTSATTSGVKAHPGDTGMDNIAKMFFEKVNISLSTSDILYTTLPSGVEINGENHEITEEEGTLALTAKVLPADSAQEVLWSLVSENAESYATISALGVLTAINNGTVTVRATSRFDSTIYDEVTVEISGQTEPITVTYDGNADDATVPEPNTMAKKGFRLDNVNAFASRPGYNFLGWTLTPDGDVVDYLEDATTDTTVYAKWALADEWNFDREGYAENFSFEYAFHQKVLDGYLSVTATGTTAENTLTVISPELILNAEDYSTLILTMQNADKASDTNLKVIVSAGGNEYEYTAAVSTTDYTNYYFDLKDLNAKITGFKIIPTNIDCAVNIDRIKFVKKTAPDYASKPAEYSSAYGNLVYFDNFSGEDFGNVADVLVLGPGATVAARMGRMAALVDNSTLGDSSLAGIVIKAADGETFKYTDGRAMEGTFTVVFEMYNSTDKQYSFYSVVDKNPGGWDSWAGYYTAWGSKKAAPASWMTHTGSSASVGRGAFGFLNSNALGNKIAISSVALYFMPDKAVTFIDDDKKTVIDLNGLDTVKLPEPASESLTGWKSGKTVYAALDTVDAESLDGKVFTSCAANTGKITYTGVSYEYLLIEGDSESYTVKNDNYPEWDISYDGSIKECIGWSTEENDDTAVTTIDVTTDGVILYPVWETIAEAIDYEIEVTGETAIVLDNADKTYTYEAVFTPEIEYNTVKWSVSDDTVATIDENGVLTPIKSGNITVFAKADYYPGKVAEIDVEISYKEGYEPITVSFEGDVAELPESFEIIPGKLIDLTPYLKMVENNEAKRFNGWILNGDSSVIYTDKVEALSGTDMVFTAVVNYDFNYAVPQTLSGYYNHGKWEQKDGMLVCIPNGSGQDNFASITVNAPASRFEAVELYMDINYTQNGEVKQFKETHKGMEFYYTTDSVTNKYHSAGVVGFTDDGKYAIIRTDVFDDKWSGTVKAIRCDFLGNDYNFGYNIRYVRFVEKPQMEETVLTIDGIDTPVTGFTPDTSASVSEKYAGIDSITWSCSEDDSFLESGNFNENTAYTVTVKVSCTDAEKIFNDVVTASINGEEADVSFASDGSVLVSYTFDATDAFLEFDAEISGKDVITRAGRSVQYKFVVTGNEIPDKTATWSIDNTDIAVMTADGKLVAKKNGTLKITAISNYNPAVTAEFDVTIEGLDETYIAVTFDKGTADEVTGMPEDMSVQVGKIAIPEEAPSREGYIFLGWTEGEDSTDVINSLVASEDVTLVALWGTGHIWNFNNSKDGFAVDGGSITTSDTYLIASTNDFPDIRLYSPATDFDPKRFNKVLIRLATETAEKADVFFSTDGAGISAGKMQSVPHTKSGLDNWQTLTFDFSANGQYTGANKITKLWIDPFDVKNNTAYVDYIAVLDSYRTITFDAGEGTLPEAYANGVIKETGTNLSLTEEANLEGYAFLGWSKTEGGDVITSLTVRDNTTLYAVYGEKLGAETESIILDEDEVVLVKSSANTSVSISYTTPDGEKTWHGNTNANGYAVAELETGVELTDFAVEPEDAEAVVCDKDTAEEKANAVPEESDTTIKVDGVPVNGSDNSGSKQYDTTVEELTKPGTIFPSGNGETSSVAAEFAKGAPVIFGFDEDYQKDLFSEVTNLKRGYEPDSVLSYRIFSKKLNAAVTSSLTMDGIALDTNEFKYVVIRARAVGFENPALRLYFTDDNTTSYTKLASVFNTLTDEYDVYVYDMSANKQWDGTVNSIRFTSENNSGGSVDFDWIMFTDEIPEDTSELDKAYDIFEATVDGDMPFTDVLKNKWSYTEIAQSYKRGFVKGTSETTFAPDANVTLAEAITIAVRLNHIFNGKDAVENAAAGNWYDTYVAAALDAKIIRRGQFDNYDRPATRREVALIMENAVPSYYLEAINMFESVPDVEEGSTGEKEIVKLYCAGVLTGNDAEFNFLPENNITREELAAIVNRVALPSARKRVYTDLERLSERKVYEGTALTSIAIWSCADDRFTLDKDGIGRTVSTGTDPILILDTMTGRFNGKDVQKIRLGVVWNKETTKLEPQLYYGTLTSPGHAWQRMVTGQIGETDERGVTEVVFDMTTQSAFQDTVRDLRFDPFDLKDEEFGIAYLILE